MMYQLADNLSSGWNDCLHRDWNWNHIKPYIGPCMVLILLLCIDLYRRIFRDRPIGDSKDLTREFPLVVHLSKSWKRKVRMQDMILLGRIVDHCASLIGKEVTELPAFHWNKEGLLCEGWALRKSLIRILFREPIYLESESIRLRSYLKNINDSLFYLKVGNGFYELKYRGKYDKDSMKSAERQINWILHTFNLLSTYQYNDERMVPLEIPILLSIVFADNYVAAFWIIWNWWNSSTRNYGDSIGNISYLLNDIGYEFSYRIPILKRKCKLYLGENDDIRLEYQYIDIMMSIIEWWDRFFDNKNRYTREFFPELPMYNWNNEGLNDESITHSRSIILDEIKRDLSEHRTGFVSLIRESQDQDSYYLTCSEIYGYKDEVIENMKSFSKQIDYLLEILWLFRGKTKDARKDDQMGSIVRLLSRTKNKFVKSMMGTIVFECSIDLVEGWENVNVNKDVTKLFGDICNDCKLLINEKNWQNSRTLRYLRDEQYKYDMYRQEHEFKLRDFNAELKRVRNFGTFWFRIREENNKGYDRFLLILFEMKYVTEDICRLQSAIAQMQWIINIYGLLSSLSGMRGNGKLHDMILMNLGEVLGAMVREEKRILTRPCKLIFNLPDRCNDDIPALNC